MKYVFIVILLFASSITAENWIPGCLEQLTLAEKQNTEIQLELESKANDNAISLSHMIEEKWNNGSFDDALMLLDDLSKLTDLSRASLYEDWKTPVICSSTDKFGTDVLIVNRDSVRFVEIERHQSSGNLIAILLVEGDGSTNILMAAVSSNGGESWNEGTRMHLSSEIYEISAAVHDDHCYVIYRGDKPFSDYDQVIISRFNCFTGYREDFPGGVYSLDIIEDFIKEVEISCADYGLDNHYIYFSYLNYFGYAHVERLNMTDFSRTYIDFVTGVDRGMDLAATVSIWKPVFISYISITDYAHVAMYKGTESNFVDQMYHGIGTSMPDETALDVYGINIVCVFETNYSSEHNLMQAFSTDIGENWTKTLFHGSSSYNWFSPSISMYGGGGLGIAYNRQAFTIRTGRFHWQPQDSLFIIEASGTSFADNFTTYRQDIVSLGGGNFGIAFLSYDWQAWYDNGSGCCQVRGDVAEPKDGSVLVNDIVALVDYLFKGGAAPACLAEGDCAIPLDESILVNDIVWLVDYLFKGGSAPPSC